MWSSHCGDLVPGIFETISSDPENKVVVITGAGTSFIDIPASGLPGGGRPSAARWDQVVRHGYRLVMRHLEIPVPVITAVNGPVPIHSEIAVLSDIVLCSEDTYFQD